MRAPAKLIILAIAPLLMAALWMDRQPSYKPYQPPLLTSPADSVPTSGREVGLQEINPVKATTYSLKQGKTLFSINCTICHGEVSSKPGSVGQKLNPPPPGLARERVKELSDAGIFKAITFGFGRMPPFRNKLSPSERWKVVNFLRTRN
ncbi:MAG: cytochrome c [Geobacteraceae bacterium]